MSLERFIRFFAFILVYVIVMPISSMLFTPLNHIERGLVFYYIEKHGIDAVRQEVQNATQPKTSMREGLYTYDLPTVLVITANFEKKNINNDFLTRNIFEQIEAIEKKSGYVPTRIGIKTETHFRVAGPTNFLNPESKETLYFWIEKNGEKLPEVRIEARLTNKPELEKIVAGYIK